ncbi:MAG TPA: division/cell wall cluster transcriptional repressor MraZ [Ktedonobacterales bacterium]|nr:division/cell wall cluster transcriptional repressor MraZ [Ktedonobacterales bacterium]
MFLGEFQYRLDAKGRLAIPARFRSKIEGGAALTRGVEQCLYVYPLDTWDQKGRELEVSITDPRKRQMLMRRFFGTAAECEMDGQGRIVVPAKFRKYAELTGEAMVIGVRDHFEIWSLAAWERYQDAMEQEDLSDLALPF